MQQTALTMAKVVSVLAFMVFLTVVVEGRDWRSETAKRVKRGYNSGHFGHGDGSYGRSNEHNGSGSKEQLGCSDEEEDGSYGSGSRELSYNRDNRQNENRRHRSFNKASASASASAVAINKDHKQTKL